MAALSDVDIDRRQAWWGPAYVSALAAQAGYLWTPTPGEGDIHSFDGSVVLRIGHSTFIQVKCFRTPMVRSKSYRIQTAWRRNWSQLDTPAYFVGVQVPNDVSEWVQHRMAERDTLLRSAAFWTRIDPLMPQQRSIQLVASRRLTAETFDGWRQDVEDDLRGRFGMAVGL